jgi:hypothetical protein
MQLGLRRDFEEIYAHLAHRVRAFDPAANNGPGDGGLVKRIDVGFESDQSAWVVVTFDARPDAEPDGQWTLYFAGNELKRPHWLEANEALREDDLALVLPDGSRVEIPAVGFWAGRYRQLATALGGMRKGVLLRARADGLFAALPKAADCELGVEHFNGAYGWPVYEDRGVENLAEPSAAADPARDIGSPDA